MSVHEPAVLNGRGVSGWRLRAVALGCALIVWCAAVACHNSGTARAPSGSGDSSAAAAGGLLLVRGRELLVHDRATGQERLLQTAPSGAYHAYPRWSPDRSQVAYVLMTNPTAQVNQDWGSDVWVSRRDGSDARVVARRAASGTTVAGLAWSADGAALYIATVYPEPANTGSFSSRLKLERLALTGGVKTLIATDAAYPTVAGDGSRIAFVTFGNDGRPSGLWTAKPDGSEQMVLVSVGTAQSLAGVRAPQFAPDGAHIAFGAVEPVAAELTPPACRGSFRWPWRPRVAAAHGPPIDLWLVGFDGHAPVKVAGLGADDPWLSWSPDGSELAILEVCGLFVLPASGGAARKIGDGAAQAQLDWR